MKKLIVMLAVLVIGAGSVIAQEAPRHDDHADHGKKENKHHRRHHPVAHKDDHRDDHKGGDRK